MKSFIQQNKSLLAVSWGHFVNDFFMSMIPVVLYVFAIELDLNAKQVTLLLFLITTGGTFFQPFVGLIIDKVQKSSLLIYALILISVGMSMAGLIRNYYLLAVVVSVSALASSVYHPLGSTITIHKTSFTRGKSLSIFMTVGSFAHTAAPIVAIPLVSKYGLNALAYMLIPGLLSAGLLYLTKVHRVTWDKEKDVVKNKKHKKMTLLEKAHVTLPMIIAVGKGVLYRVPFVFGVLILGLKGLDTVPAAAVLSAFMFARTIATLIGGFISDTIGEKRTLMLFNTIAVVAVVMLTFGNLTLAIVGMVLLGFTINSTSAANITITHKIMPNNINYGTGLIMGFAATLSAVAMLGYGVVVDEVGHEKSLYILVGIAVLMMILSYIIPKEYET